DLRVERLPRSAIVWSNAGAYNTCVTAHALALLLAAAKDVVMRTEEIRRGIFDQSVMNKALAGSTVLLLGMGGIGAEVARLCKSFRMRTIGLSRSRPRDPAVDEAGTIGEMRGRSEEHTSNSSHVSISYA